MEKKKFDGFSRKKGGAFCDERIDTMEDGDTS